MQEFSNNCIDLPGIIEKYLNCAYFPGYQFVVKHPSERKIAVEDNIRFICKLYGNSYRITFLFASED